MTNISFDELVRRHLGAVSAYAKAMCGDRHLADDAVQNTLIRAWKYFDTFDSRGSFEGWLLRICRNCVFDITKAASGLDSSATLDKATEDQSCELIDLMKHLPLAQREVVVLCCLVGYDYESAAQLLDVPVGTIRSRLSRGRTAIARMLQDAEVAGAEVLA